MAQQHKLFVDLDTCSSKCPACTVSCSYFYHPGNTGFFSLEEILTYILVCRKCEEPHCVNACPQNALEKQDNNILKRYLMRCIGCKSCVHACPYGTIYPEHVPYVSARCDLCVDRCDQKGEPLCVATCPYHALEVKDIAPDEAQHLYAVAENLVVHSTHWMREKA